MSGNGTEGLKAAMHWHREGERVACTLCAHNCRIPDGHTGICRVRKNIGGTLYSLIYEHPSSIAVDPVEKKGLSHFLPGSQSLSFGTAGCNFSCSYCQNSSMTKVGPGDIPSRRVPASELPRMAKENRSASVTWTYNEPTIWHEWSLEGAKALKAAGIHTIYKTNGYINEEPLREIAPYLDALSIDVKGWSQDIFYRRLCRSKLQPVLDTCVLARELKRHLELTYLVIPGYNDRPEDLNGFSSWAAGALGPDTPVHFTRFHPDFMLTNVPPTPLETLTFARTVAMERGLQYVYLGNVEHGDYENTHCPSCGALLIERNWFRVHIRELTGDNRCGKCGRAIPIFGRAERRQASASPRAIF